MDAVGAVRLIALGLGFVGVAAAIANVVRPGGERPLAPFSLLLGVLGLAASAAMAVLLPPISFKTPVLWALVGGGALAGVLAGRAVHVDRDARGVLVRGGSWHLLPASLALVGLQAGAVAGTIDGVVAATAAIVACSAFAVAAGGLVLLRGSVVRLAGVRVPTGVAAQRVGTQAEGAGPPATPPVATASRSAAAASRSATAPSALAGTGSQVRIACGACGAPVRAGWRHCVTCGTALAWE